MYYWHINDCLTPDVHVTEAGRPSCRTCNGVAPDIARILKDNQAGGGGPTMPPDRKMGQLNLSWPSSVCYASSSTGVCGDVLEDNSETATVSKRVTPDITHHRHSTSSYAETLSSDEIRLICLPAMASYDDPLHVTLEVYELEDCPEYETLSYTWAGEDGDGTFSRPIYIGPSWDMLLQTKNCWEMLRFMRPRRGMRMLWVDAVCINQANISERNTQVANMSSIYSAGSRVVVYLGPDIAVPLNARHARRRRLHELESGAVTPNFPQEPPSPPPPHTLSDLLKRRYFSRIWVIQELLLCQRVVMRVGDVDFWADPAMMTHFAASLPGWTWENTPAPWLQHIAQGGSSIKGLRDAIRMSFLSQATDPRDRIFGLLGILSQISEPSRPRLDSRSSKTSSLRPSMDLYADYSIPCQHVFIGLFAYCLLTLKEPQILFHALGYSSSLLGLPSWAPDWRRQTTWQLLFRAPNFSSKELYAHMTDVIEQRWSSDHGGHTVSPFILYELTGPGDPRIEKERPWWRDAYIETSSGALNVNLTHCMRLSGSLKRVGSIRGFGLFSMQVSTLTVHILCEHELQSDRRDRHIYVLNEPHKASKIFLVLEPRSDKGFTLISACPFVLIQTSSMQHSNQVGEMQSLELQDLQWNLNRVVTEFNEILEHRETLNYFAAFCSPGLAHLRKLLPLFVLLSEYLPNHEDWSPTTQWLGQEIGFGHIIPRYMECLEPRLSPRIDGLWIIVTVSQFWAKMKKGDSWDYRVGDAYKLFRWQINVPGSSAWDEDRLSSSSYQITKKWDVRQTQTVYARRSFKSICSFLESDWTFKSIYPILQRLRHTCRIHGMDLNTVIHRRSQDEATKLIGCPSAKEIEMMSMRTLWSTLQTKGGTEMVSIN